eukprot:CAMPEP_0118934906 /NCGR_PEP_ID=MMETSP1169-20130426/14469_1 /TAXON_ID=36882 /ORGANISM="Pyramimonas obovata, Strain CCMP722" /LENGTH=95 /DNA_ID=CAMNT_0006877867 /DNA_START=280 /DNA_END=568 /DNA_ORIENTATION=+
MSPPPLAANPPPRLAMARHAPPCAAHQTEPNSGAGPSSGESSPEAEERRNLIVVPSWGRISEISESASRPRTSAARLALLRFAARAGTFVDVCPM